MRWIIYPWFCTDYLVFYVFMSLMALWAAWVTIMLRRIGRIAPT